MRDTGELPIGVSLPESRSCVQYPEDAEEYPDYAAKRACIRLNGQTPNKGRQAKEETENAHTHWKPVVELRNLAHLSSSYNSEWENTVPVSSAVKVIDRFALYVQRSSWEPITA
jgi:hypothetical protein